MQSVMAQPPQAPTYGAMPVRRKPITQPGISVRPPQQQMYTEAQLGHSRSRTTSSGVFPTPVASSPTVSTMSSQYPTQYQSGLRRTPTSSTSSTTGTPNRSNSGNLRRSSSARSGTSPTSYVALMRKQKATVWCDRAQYEDPRILAQQRQAKMRANMEVAGGPHHAPPRSASGGASMTGGVRSKIGRHHGLPKASLYAPVTYAGSGVPMRLSATEVDEGDDEDAASIGQNGAPYHHRTGSGRSSLGSGRRMSYANPGGRHSSNSTPPQNSSPEDLGDLQEEEPTPNPLYDPTTGYFVEHTKTNLSIGSGSSGERNFGDVGQMPQSLPKPIQEKKGSDDLLSACMFACSDVMLFVDHPAVPAKFSEMVVILFTISPEFTWALL
ncbi:uncharacterized protein K460DRAFT_353068 [Cucurbitaria berberidis CBS 394.84]|uniref:Uncharacterized protein n=1 Tax=Cucurbitaria berberidis CBS 394.84 TaxID=1168544 RepID=A0A9P4GKK1_9PLEO|nr:uncharacterized protein K460DRAFT_353068 [Cucurbitaria berberidis CBS 394.84]KAF1848028.1 hypothetical protein K460DRAFT_353068 [Cucurbitaria berberidis CBS 394.84]